MPKQAQKTNKTAKEKIEKPIQLYKNLQKLMKLV